MMSLEISNNDSKHLFHLLSRSNNTPNLRMEVLEGLDNFAKSVSKTPLTIEAYSLYLKTIHDVLVRAETTVRSELLRIIRYGLTSPQHGAEIINQVKYCLSFNVIYYDLMRNRKSTG